MSEVAEQGEEMNLPTPQVEQAEQEDEAVEGWKFDPTEHGVQESVAPVLYVPARHSSTPVRSALAFVPAPFDWHEEEPGAVLNVPSSHDLQSSDPPTLYLPTTHVPHW